MNTLVYLIQRLALAVPMILGTAVFTFLVIHLVPGDPVKTMLGLRATPESIAAAREQLGLDRPLLAQFWTWMSNLFRGDLGQDFISHMPVSTLIGERLPVTVQLALSSMALGVVGGVSIGLLTASGSRRVARFGEAFSIIGISVPYFWLGIILALVFGAYLELLPPSGFVPFSVDPVAHVRYMILPILTLAIGQAAYLSRVTRGIATDLMSGPSVQLMRAKGLSRYTIVFKHVLRQASSPILTIIGIEVGVLLGGAIIIESIFGLPGIGNLVVTAVQQRNYTVVQGCVLVISAMFILATVLTDVAVQLVDPRHGRRSA